MNECPKCGCTNPRHHPAVQEGGEVHLCENPWHQPTAAEIRAREAREEYEAEERQRVEDGMKAQRGDFYP